VGAASALGCVTLLGFALHRPLSRIPENTLKFAVGVLLSAFGTFWVGEGVGVAWPAQDWSLLALAVIYLLTGSGLVLMFRGHAYPPPVVSGSTPLQPRRRLISRLLQELVSLFVDDGWLALGAVAWVALFTLGLRVLRPAPVLEALEFTAGLGAILCFSAARGVRGASDAPGTL
jgi:hypothetical protein